MNYLERIAERVINGNDTDWAMNINAFDWVPGVGLFGIYKAYTATGKYLDFLTDWADRHLREASVQRTVNSTAPMLTVLQLYKETGNKRYLDAALEAGGYIMQCAPLTREGGLEHTVTEEVEGFSEQMWADTLFMACIFIAELGDVTGDKAYTDFAVKQTLIHHKVLSDGSGLYFHGWNCKAHNSMSAVRWARANAWIILSSMYILNAAGEFEGRATIENYVKKHSEALKAVQTENGAYRTILDDASAYEEMSATAGITAGLILARRENLIGEEFDSVIERGVKAVENATSENGEVNGVSTGTPVMKNAEEYKQIQCCPTLYGQGLAMIMFAELTGGKQ